MMDRSIAAVLRALDDGRGRAEFYRMCRMGMGAGMAHPTILRRLGPFSGPTQALQACLVEGTTRRNDVATIVRRFPERFEPFEAALLTAGDESGRLAAVLGTLADFFERQYRMMLTVKKHLAYPLFTSFFAILIAPLPLVFRGMVGTYVVTVALGIAGWAAFGGAFLASRARAYQRRPAFVRARFARTLAITLGAGLPLGRALRLAAGASGDDALERFIAQQDERTLSTRSLEETLTGAPTITPDLLGAVRVAERTGDLETTLVRLAELYEDGFR